MGINKVVISGGGTGGHIFPAIAIADRIKEKYPEAEVVFVGAEGKMEMEKVPKAGYEIVGLPIRGIQRRLTLKNLAVPFKLWSSLRIAKKLVKQFKPDIAIGVGGYASAATLRVASKLKVPTLIQEQNSYPGITNKWLGKSVNTICVAYDHLERFFPKEKIVKTGNPVRANVIDIQGKREQGLMHFGLNPAKNTVLIIGGSLGAKTLNDSLKLKVKDLIDSDVQVIWQCGKFYSQELNAFVANLKTDLIYLSDFVYEMDYAYAAADVIVSRAGAISVSEVSLIGKPVILVPSPNVAEDHQTKNALALVNENAAVLIKDQEAREQLVPKIIAVLKDDELKSNLSKNIKQLGISNATDRILTEIEKLTKNS